MKYGCRLVKFVPKIQPLQTVHWLTKSLKSYPLRQLTAKRSRKKGTKTLCSSTAMTIPMRRNAVYTKTKVYQHLFP